MFVILVLLWLFRDPRFIPGWGSLFKSENNIRLIMHIYYQLIIFVIVVVISFVTDSTSVLAVVFLLFLIPSEPCCCTWSSKLSHHPMFPPAALVCSLVFLEVLKAGKSPRLLDWDSIQKSLPWNVVFILGSGFAIAEAAEVKQLLLLLLIE